MSNKGSKMMKATVFDGTNFMIFEIHFGTCCQFEGCLKILDSLLDINLLTGKTPINHKESESSNDEERECDEHVDTDSGKSIFHGNNQFRKKHQLAAWFSVCAVGQVKEEIQAAWSHLNDRTK